MKTYEKYKDSDIDWIGEIPAHWKVKRGKYFLNLTNGYPFNSKQFKQDESVGLPLVRIRDINKDVFETFYDGEEVESAIVKNNDVLIGMDGDFNIAKWKGVKGLLNQRICKLNKTEVYDNNYYYYVLPSALKIINDLTYFTTVKHLSNSDLFEFSFPFPSKEEQTAIANYLDKKTAEIDQLIAEKEQLVALYQEEKTAIINQAVTKGINPDVKLKDSGIEWLGDIPEHWEDIRLKYLGNFINGYSFKSTDFKSSGVRVLKISNIQHMSIDWSDESFIDEEFYDTKSDFRVLQNDLVFALTRPIISTGIKVALMDSDEKILLNQRNSIFRPKMKMTKWIYFILLSSRFVQEFDKQIDKTGQQPNISSNDIGEISIPVPPKEEQTEIVQHIENESERIDAKIAKAKKYINLLTEYRTALISEVVTGKIKVI